MVFDRIFESQELLEKGVFEGVVAAGETIKIDIRKRWTKPGPSTRGQAPAILTGNLDQSVFVDPPGSHDLAGIANVDGKIVARLRVQTEEGPLSGGRDEYSSVLEDDMERPFFEVALERNQDALPYHIGRVVRPIFR